MFEWTQKRIEWYERAIKWTGYDKALACAVKPYLDNGSSVCDLGCGTGYLALELARQGFTVSAVEKSLEAMDFLKGSTSSVVQLEMIHNDWVEVSGRRWDNVIMCQTGNFGTELSYYLTLCNKKLILIGKSRSRRWPRGGGSAAGGFKTEELNEILKAQDLRFMYADFSAEFGQPLKSLEEAEDYLNCYEIKDEAYKRALETIEPTGDFMYPLYMPYKKEMGIWVINKGL